MPAMLSKRQQHTFSILAPLRGAEKERLAFEPGLEMARCKMSVEESTS